MKKILTLEQLVNFCEQQNLTNFDSNSTGYRLAVQVPASFDKYEDVEDDTLLFCKIKAFHIGRNRNKSNVTEDAAKKAMKTMAYKPVLANFCEIEDENGEMVKDFTSHDMIYDSNGNVQYLEHQIGCFTYDAPWIEHDDELDKDFIYAYVAIPREYTDACEIIERKNGTKVSVELLVNNMEYDAKNKELLLTDIIVSGVTCLGTNPDTGEKVEEGMLGSRLDLEDFSSKNSVFTQVDGTKLIETLDKLNTTLSNFNINDFNGKEDKTIVENEENNVEEVTESVTEDTADEVKNTETENVTEETTEEVTAETEEESEEETVENTPDVEVNEVEEKTENEAYKKSVNSLENGNLEVTFEISHEEIRSALYNLISQYDELDNDWYYISAVYDDKFIMEGWYGNIYGQKYSKDGDNIALEGERYKLYVEYLTETEKASLEDMRSNYSSISEKLANYEAKECEEKKVEILTSKDYSAITENEEFKALVDNHTDFSVEDVQAKADEILLNYVKAGNKVEFSSNEEEPKNKEIGKKSLPIIERKKSRYGTLFSK